MIHIEDIGSWNERPQDKLNTRDSTTIGRGEIAYHQLRQFVVVKIFKNQRYAYCWYVVALYYPSCVLTLMHSPITNHSQDNRGRRSTNNPSVDATQVMIQAGPMTPPTPSKDRELKSLSAWLCPVMSCWNLHLALTLA